MEIREFNDLREAMSDAAYFLRRHVFLCLADEYGVFLDLRRDRYFCVERERLESLGASVAKALCAKGLLTTERSEGREFRPTVCAAPGRALLPEPPDELPESRGSNAAVTPLEIAQFAVACAGAAWRLRFWSIERVVLNVERRRPRHWRADLASDTRCLTHRVAVFRRVRPWYPRDYLCLFDSLALLYFLARDDCFPRWTFGVAAEPFEAHCWVQEGSVVLNDTVERVSLFTPIMAV